MACTFYTDEWAIMDLDGATLTVAAAIRYLIEAIREWNEAIRYLIEAILILRETVAFPKESIYKKIKNKPALFNKKPIIR